VFEEKCLDFVQVNNERSKGGTLARDKKMASTYSFGKVYQSDHAFGN